MNIDYARIIERANYRKERLEAISALLNDASEKHLQLSDIIDWVIKVNQEYRDLDQEGRLLVPEAIRCALEYLPSSQNSLQGARVSGKYGLFYLVPKDAK
jgi:hypothetical protein